MPGRTAVAIAYYDRVALRQASLYADGALKQTFGADDELWVPLAEDGYPVTTAEPLRVNQLAAGEEYETLYNAIDLALSEAGYAQATSCQHIVQIAYEV
jgi:hypothetical protein